MNLKRLFNWDKRINRTSYWLAMLIFVVVYFIWIGLLFGTLFSASSSSSGSGLIGAITGILSFGIFIFFVCWWVYLTRQRSIDISAKDWLLWFLLGLLIIGPIIGFIPSEDKRNRFGPKPTRVNLFK